MRNLKKILALVLALIMSLSLMATAGAGSFQDVTDDNPYKTAIDVLDELKVFQGFEDGSFKPTDTLNRAQAAVLVYRIATGDVEGKYIDNYTYMAQSKFNDLEGYNWAKGYINYCQNAGIVVGTSATTFAPGAKVTGYQLLVMLLRTLGYGKAGEFADPKGWELQTAAIAEREGITKNVTGGDFENPAPRQMVAEILFRGLLTETVQYSALTPGGYTKSGETLGKRELGLEDIKGVVMANEFADLEDDDTLAEGKTRLDVDGKTYNLDVSSELTDIGEIRHAYVQNGTKVLTTLENQGDSVVNQPENGAATKVKDLSKTNSDTQYFLNFEETAKYSSAYKIKYVTVYDSAAEATAAQKRINDASGAKTGSTEWARISNDGDGNATVVTRTIPAKDTITSVDLSMMKEIFGVKDKWAGEDSLLESGAVYVGTQSIVDISDVESEDLKYSYDKFEEEFITDKNIAIEDSDNGEWLKTIDNDGDGVAEYVFRTDFVMSVIDDYNTKNETYYVEYDAASTGTDRKANDTIKKSAVVTEDELAVGDVILYTWIDGKCYVDHPEVDTAAIDKKGIDYKAKTITCGDTTYDWSGIEQEAYHYYHDVSEANVEVNYNLYKDHFGYVRLFAEANKGFVLLTDGFYATDLKKEHTYKAEIWDAVAAELTEVDVASDAFIDTTIDANSGKREEGTWDRLLAFDESYPTHVDGELARKYITTIAAFDTSADGVYDLAEVESYSNRYYYTQHELDVNSFDNGSVKDKDLTVTANHQDKAGKPTDNPDLDRINATDETVYYYVQYKDNDKREHNEIVDVTTWTGYKEGSVKLVDGDRAYAVTRAYREADNSDWVNYETAEIIVIEHKVAGKTNVVFPVTLTQRLIGTRNQIGGNGFVWGDESGAWALDEFTGKYKAQVSETVKSVDDDNIAPVDISDLLHFYKKESNGELTRIDENFAKYNIYAGVIVTEIGTVSRSYGEIGLADGRTDIDPDDIAPKHDFYKASDNFYTIGYDRDSATEKDEMLHVPGYQYDWLYGDVAATFNASGLDSVDMNRGDLVLYVTDGDGVVQSVINVTESEMKKNYDPDSLTDGKYPGVYKTDDHTTNDTYTETYTLLTLWNDIADDQAKDHTAKSVVKFYGDDTPDAVNGTTITVSYKTAKDWDEKNASNLTVANGSKLQLINNATDKAVENNQPVPNPDGAQYTLTFLGDDGKIYTYKLVQKAQSDIFGNMYSTDYDLVKVTKAASSTGYDYIIGVIPQIDATLQDILVQDVVDVLACTGSTIIVEGSVKALSSTWDKVDPSTGNAVAMDESITAARYLTMTLENDTGARKNIVIYIDENAATKDVHTITVQDYYKETSGTATNYQAYWNYQYNDDRDTVVPSRFIVRDGSTKNAKITVGNEQTLDLVAVGEGDWSKVSGNVKLSGIGYNSKTGKNSIRVDNILSDAEVKFTPKASTTNAVTIETASDKVTLPATTTQNITSASATFNITVANDVAFTVTASNGKAVTVNNFVAGATTSTWDVAVAFDNTVEEITLTVETTPVSYSLSNSTLGATRNTTTGAVTLDNANLVIPNYSSLPANDVITITYHIEILNVEKNTWGEVSGMGGTFTDVVGSSSETGNHVVSMSGANVSIGGGSSAGTYKVVGTIKVASNNQVLPFESAIIPVV